MRIVVCDDSTVERTQTARMLREGGHEIVAQCVDGIEALAAVAQLQPDCVVLDVVMRRMSGDAAALAMRERGYTGAIVMVSHHSSTALRSAAETVGATLCPKPFRISDILNAVSRTIGV